MVNLGENTPVPEAPHTTSSIDVNQHKLTRCFGYLRPRSGEAHGQQHVQAGGAFDGARSVLSEPPREDFTVNVLLGSHGSLSTSRPDTVRPEREAPASPWSATASVRGGKQKETDAKRSRQERCSDRQSRYSAHWKNWRMEEKRQMRTRRKIFSPNLFYSQFLLIFFFFLGHFFLSWTFNPFYRVYSYSDLFPSESFYSRNGKLFIQGCDVCGTRMYEINQLRLWAI